MIARMVISVSISSSHAFALASSNAHLRLGILLRRPPRRTAQSTFTVSRDVASTRVSSMCRARISTLVIAIALASTTCAHGAIFVSPTLGGIAVSKNSSGTTLGAVSPSLIGPLSGTSSTQADAKLVRSEARPLGRAVVGPPPTGQSEAHPQWLSLWFLVQFPFLSQVIAGLSFTVAIKVCCMLGNVLVQLSPYIQVKQWESRSSTGEADAAPYVSIAFGGWQWCSYGLFAWLHTGRAGFLILVYSNCLGALLGTYYVAAFYRCCRNQGALQMLGLYLSAAGILALFQACSFAVLPSDRSLFLTGLISSFSSFMGAVALLTTIPAVIRARDSSSIPGPIVTANLGSSALWCLCGWILDDPLVTGPNVICSIACAVCIGMKVWFPSAESAPGADQESVPASLPKRFYYEQKSNGALSESTPLCPTATTKRSATTTQCSFQPATTAPASSASSGRSKAASRAYTVF
ncbi:unnamed protein product [Prorocentrum cordatum]|uniref:Sugar transporter SWEET1 n=1 Tax=Prorocentrum cordatum TaxID=2364126 RepID=A0ABN9VY89_9DINO|nr:unnamed protein product [Polarella glacialis]